MLRAAVISENSDKRKLLYDMLCHFSRQSISVFPALFSSEEIHIRTYSDGDAFLDDFHAQFDLLLIDVQMSLADGLTIALELRHMDPFAVILLFSENNSCALSGYRVQAFDLLTYPVSFSVFSDTLHRALSYIACDLPPTLRLKTREGVIRLSVADICYIESQGHTLVIHTDAFTYHLTDTLKHMEELLGDAPVFRCSSGCLVHLSHVIAVENDCVLLSDGRLPLSRSRKKNFLKALNGYWSS